MFQDLRYALRLWTSRPWQAAFAIAALAIGIGANTGVFSVVNALLLRSLPFRDPARLALVRNFIPPHDSAKQFHDWSQQSKYLDDAALYEEIDVNLGGTRVASRVHLAQTSWNFFSVLGAQPISGRGFAPDNEADAPGFGLPGRNAEVVISYGLWQQVFAADAKALGATIRLNGNPFTVIGVAPRGFDFPHQAVIWKPAAFSPGNNGWTTVARLRPGVPWAEARAAFAVEAKLLSPKQQGPNDVQPGIDPLQDALAGPMKHTSLMFMGAVMLVLLIACTNVATILTARTADRMREFSIRSALGASGGRLARQLFAECLLLSCVATLAALAIAYWITSLAAKVEPPTLAAESYSILDARVLGFTVVVSILTALIFSVLPWFYLRRVHGLGIPNANQAPGGRLVREILTGAQVMLTIILLAGSVSLGQAFVHLMRTDRGYDVEQVVTVGVSLDGTTHQLEKTQLPYFEDVLERLRRIPGVRAASATEFLPLSASAFIGAPFGLDGHPASHNSTLIPVMGDYFQTMGAPLLYGREFTEDEIRSGARVAVVNERFAQTFGKVEDAVGHQLTVGHAVPRKIIGVVRGMEYETDPTLANSTQVFVPSGTPGSFFSTFVVRVDGRAEDHLSQVRDVIQSADPQVPVFGAKTMAQRLDEVFAGPRFYRTAVWFFAGFALLLAVIGIYGIVSYAVVQRTQELGIRLALGTTPVRLRGMILRQGLLMVVAGAIPGIAGAQLTGRFLQTLISGAKPVGPGMSAGLVLFLSIIASASIWSASRRIARFNIIEILRSE
ncbi:MAG TPA: ABC transporter permease [Candidatus Acidoferrales bacterium]|nr:ABC transporter permease [Candidatus Acidoferrales bacterium]